MIDWETQQYHLSVAFRMRFFEEVRVKGYSKVHDVYGKIQSVE